jgi:hypothetical protein
MDLFGEKDVVKRTTQRATSGAKLTVKRSRLLKYLLDKLRLKVLMHSRSM